MTSEKLRAMGVETLGVVATSVERARLYLRLRPTRMAIAADQTLTTHRSYGLPAPPMTAELQQMLSTVRHNPGGLLPEPLPVAEAWQEVNRREGFEWQQDDRDDQARQSTQLIGQFLIDPQGVIRWANIEGMKGGPATFGHFPPEEELFAAARAV